MCPTQHPSRPDAEQPLDVEELFSTGHPSGTAGNHHPFRLGFGAHPTMHADAQACGQQVRSTGLSCLLASGHKGHCRSILASMR